MQGMIKEIKISFIFEKFTFNNKFNATVIIKRLKTIINDVKILSAEIDLEDFFFGFLMYFVSRIAGNNDNNKTHPNVIPADRFSMLL